MEWWARQEQTFAAMRGEREVGTAVKHSWTLKTGSSETKRNRNTEWWGGQCEFLEQMRCCVFRHLLVRLCYFLVKGFIGNRVFVSCIVVLIRSFTRVPVNEASCVRACMCLCTCMCVYFWSSDCTPALRIDMWMWLWMSEKVPGWRSLILLFCMLVIKNKAEVCVCVCVCL